MGEWDRPQVGVLQVVAQGESRFRILERRTEPSGLQRAHVELIPEDEDAAVPAHCSACVRLLERVIEQHAGLLAPPHRLQSASWVSARLAELLPLPLTANQELLELADAAARLDRLNPLLPPTVRQAPCPPRAPLPPP